VFLFKARQLV